MTTRALQLAELLGPSLPRVQYLFECFADAGEELLMVGGCVRDLLLKVPPKDVDFATSAWPAKTKAILAQVGLKVLPIGEDFGTIATLIEGETFEITTYRAKESYKKGSRHPVVVFGDSIGEDLGRRDLTINAIAMDQLGHLIDPFDGAADIRHECLRVPEGGFEKSVEILADDPLRTLRVARFSARLNFAPEPALTQAAKQVAGAIVHVAHERWQIELTKMLLAPWPERGLHWLDEVGALALCVPEIYTSNHKVKDAHHLLFAAISSLPATPESRWAWLLLHGARLRALTTARQLVIDLVARLRLSNAFKKALLSLVDGVEQIQQSRARNEDFPTLARRLALCSGAQSTQAIALYGAFADPGLAAELSQQFLELQEKESLEVKLPPQLASVLMKSLALTPGPHLGTLIDAIREAMLCGQLPVPCPRQAAIEYAKRLIDLNNA